MCSSDLGLVIHLSIRVLAVPFTLMEQCSKLHSVLSFGLISKWAPEFAADHLVSSLVRARIL